MAVKTLFIAYHELEDKYKKLKSMLTPSQLSKFERGEGTPQPTVLVEDKTNKNKPTEQPEDVKFKGYSFKGW